MTLKPEEMYTAGEFAALVGVDSKTVARWAKAGKVPFIRTPGGHRRYRESVVRAVLNGTPIPREEAA
jgi:excisionase family DNA binding protein